MTNPTVPTIGQQVMHRGEAVATMRDLPAAAFQVICADPPYSSGGLFRGDRAASTTTKYLHSSVQDKRIPFTGDNRDQRAYLAWSWLWMDAARRVAEPGGYMLCFTDWRQIGVTIDAVQAAGWIYRGLCPLDKGPAARAPHTGYFRHQCEYVVWGSNGGCPKADGRGPFPGLISAPIRRSDKFHQAGKPTDGIAQLLRCARPDGLVLDPFGGSGTTLAAARRLGLGALAIEDSPEIYAAALRRLGIAS